MKHRVRGYLRRAPSNSRTSPRRKVRVRGHLRR